MPFLKVINPADSGAVVETVGQDGPVFLKPGESVVTTETAALELVKRFGFMKTEPTDELPTPPKPPALVTLEGTLPSDVAVKVVEQYPTLHIKGSKETPVASPPEEKKKRKYERKAKTP